MASVLLLAILSGFHTLNAACSDEDSSSSDCNNAGCFWIAGICKASNCWLPSCASGCNYQPGVPGYCRDDTGCANFIDSDTCGANSKCKMTDGTCGVSEEAKTKCAVSPDNETNCPGGCVKISATRCESQFNPPTCEYDASVSLTSCASAYGCTWNGSECVGDSEFDCYKHDNTEVSDCSNFGVCKAIGGSCVFDSDDNFCSGISVTEETTECENQWGCQVNGSECVGAEHCVNYNTTVVKVCSMSITEGCMIKDGNCVPGLDELCQEYADQCLEVGFCKLSDSQCVFDTNICDARSIEPYTECTYQSACKVVTSGGIKQCQTKTSEEYCSEISATDCEYSWTYACEVSGGGTCVPRVPVCNMNAAQTACDMYNAPSDNCVTVFDSSCVNADCSSENTEIGCTSLNDNGDSAGCEWNATGTCVANISCTLTWDGTCSSIDDCTQISDIAESCTRNPTITDATCKVNGNTASCGASPGCSWSYTGGSCVEKSCSNNPSYALCCNGTSDESCAYCAAATRPPDCPSLPPSCDTNPSYATCCSSGASCAYCAAATRPPDCPSVSPDCNVTPDAAGCDAGSTPSSAFNVIAAAALVLAVLFIGWF